MLKLPESQKPIIQQNYPHMLSEDTETWTQFLRSGKKVIDEVWYDLHVGKGLDLGIDEKESIQNMANALYKKRIDVIARVGSVLHIVEIKPFGNMVALGQALSYSRMFKQEYSSSGKITPTICCLNVDDDILDDLSTFGIDLWMP